MSRIQSSEVTPNYENLELNFGTGVDSESKLWYQVWHAKLFRQRFYSPKSKQRYSDEEIKAIMFPFGGPFPHTIDSIKIEVLPTFEVRIYAIGPNLKWKD